MLNQNPSTMSNETDLPVCPGTWFDKILVLWAKLMKAKLMGIPKCRESSKRLHGCCAWKRYCLGKAFWLQCRTNSIQGAFAPPKGPVKHQTTTCGRIIRLKAIWKKRRSRPYCCKGIPKKERLGPSWSAKHKYRTRKNSYLLETLTLAHSAERQLACLESKKSCKSF